MEKHIAIITVLTILFIGVFVAVAIMGGEPSGPAVVWTAVCPSGGTVTVYVPVDCAETCPAEMVGY